MKCRMNSLLKVQHLVELIAGNSVQLLMSYVRHIFHVGGPDFDCTPGGQSGVAQLYSSNAGKTKRLGSLFNLANFLESRF